MLAPTICFADLIRKQCPVQQLDGGEEALAASFGQQRAGSGIDVAQLSAAAAAVFAWRPGIPDTPPARSCRMLR
ncbi:hypothetical protein ACU4HD_44360 [Cupriavidus basilensis]